MSVSADNSQVMQGDVAARDESDAPTHRRADVLTHQSTKLPKYLPESAILLLAALIRFWRLDYHSIWFDEAVSLRWARSDAIWIWDSTLPLLLEKHPPGYFLYLHYWNNILERFGLDRSDAWLRASGAFLGVLTVLGALLLVRTLSGRKVSLVAGLLVALSPALVWYSQELRMFQPAATALVWAAAFQVWAWHGSAWWRRLLLWAGMILCWLAALYSYLFSAFLLPAAGLSLIALWLVARRTAPTHQTTKSPTYRFLEGVAALGIVTLLFLPLARNAWQVNDAESTPGTAFAGFANALWQQMRVLTIWSSGWQGWLEACIILLAAALFVAGVALPRRGRGALQQWWIGLWSLTPLVIGGAMLATTASVFGEDRYFLFLAPFVLWGVARGVVALSERGKVGLWAGWAAGGALALAMAVALIPLWSPSHARENWRAAVETIVSEHAALPALRTAVISHVDYTSLPAEWYLRQRYSFEELPLYFPFGGVLAAEEVDTVIAPPLAGVESAGFDTLWLLQSHLEGVDDERLVEGWLDARYPLVTEQAPAGIKQSAYATRSMYEALPDGVAEIGAEVAPGAILAGCEVTTPEVAAREAFVHPPSGWVHVRLWWSADGEIGADYVPQVRVVDEQGVWGEALERDGDAFDFYPTRSWQPGAFLRHEVDVNMNPETPPGEFEVTVALVAPDGGTVGETVVCGRVRVVTP